MNSRFLDLQAGANVSAADLWKFTPLHEAAAKGKFDICRLLLMNGADATKKNRDGHTPFDLVRDDDTDVADLLRGDVAILEAAKRGALDRLQKLVTAENVNCRDTQGRNSTPLHLAGNTLCLQLQFIPRTDKRKLLNFYFIQIYR